MFRFSLLAAASTLAVMSCTSSAPQIEEATAAPQPMVAEPTRPAPRPTAVSADISAGVQVYNQYCSACHNGGDETAPELDALFAFGADRIHAALGDGGLMALQGGMIDEAQEAQLVAFLTAPPAMRAQFAEGDMADRFHPDFSYPVRRIRDERDSVGGLRPPAWDAPPVGDGPFELESWEERNLQIEVVAKGLAAPRALEFLPNGDLLVTERAGQLRIIRDGKLDPTPISGTPASIITGTATGFMDIALHPDFETNQLIYISYHKPVYDGALGSNAIFRGRLEGDRIVDGKDIFLSDDVDALYSRLHFGPDGKLYATIGCPGVGTDASIGRAQHPDDFAGKTLRLNDDGTVPADNPFIGKEGYNPEIYTLGHRVNLGLELNPWTEEFWVSEHGPQGGDEVNILRATQNYGWPVLNDGRYYAGGRVSEVLFEEGITRPHISYVPSIAPGGMLFYTGDKFLAWQKNLFIGSMRVGSTPRTGHLQRLVFNDEWEVVRREQLLVDFHQRIRDVEQSPDGYLYVMTDEAENSVVLKISPKDE